MSAIRTTPARPRRRAALLLAGGCLAAAGLGGGPAIADTGDTGDADDTGGTQVEADEPTATGQVVIDDGHIDMGPRFVDDEWTVQIRDDTVEPAVWRDLAEVVVHAGDAARVEVPEDEQFAFLGAPGEEVWLLPQVQQPGVVWPGWNTQEPRTAAAINRDLTWSLHGVTGPGEFVLYLNTDFGAPEVLFTTAEDFPQDTGVERGTHVHGNWVLTVPGTYLLDIEMSADTTDGERVSDRRTLILHAGDEDDPATAFDVARAAGVVAGESAEDTAAQPDTDGAATALPAWAWAGAGAGLVLVVAAAAGTGVVLGRRRHGRADGTTAGEAR